MFDRLMGQMISWPGLWRTLQLNLPMAKVLAAFISWELEDVGREDPQRDGPFDVRIMLK